MASITKRERLLAVLLFAAAATLFWIGRSVFTWSLPSRLFAAAAVASIVAVAAVSWFAAPRLVAGARNKPDLWRGFVAGVLVTAITYVAAVILLSISVVTWTVITGSFDGPETPAMAMLSLATRGIIHAVTNFSPAMLLGGVAGVLLYRSVRSEAQKAV
ncbi:MAG: hypothetical protein AAGJ10_13915 [Bacteroidota bacterium]